MEELHGSESASEARGITLISEPSVRPGANRPHARRRQRGGIAVWPAPRMAGERLAWVAPRRLALEAAVVVGGRQFSSGSA